MKENFSTSLHGLRGIAAISVFCAHCVAGYSLHVCDKCGSTAIDRFSQLGTYGVEIFFFVSGYVIFLASLSTEPQTFLKRRFWRIYPVFIIFTILFYLGNIALGLDPEKDSLSFLAINAAFLELFAGTPSLTPNAWTISYEVWFYILTYLIVRPFVAGKRRPISAIFAFLAAAFLISYPISIYYAAGAMLSITISMYPNWHRKVGCKSINVTQFISLAFIITLASIPHEYSWDAIQENPSTLILLLSLTAFVVSLLHPASIISRGLTAHWVMWLGTVSYTLYLAHPYSYLASRMFIMGTDISELQEPLRFSIFAILTIGSTALLVWFVHYLFEAPVYRMMTGKVIYAPNTKN